MPAGRKLQSNTTLYPLITFVGLFVIATTLAIIFYIKAESNRTKAITAQSQLNKIATSAELRKIGAIVGTKQGRKSRLRTMLDYLDEMVYLIIGGLKEDTSAEVKVDTANRKTEEILGLLVQEYPDLRTDDPNTTGLIYTIEKLKIKLGNVTNTALAKEEQFKELQNRFDDTLAVNSEKEQALLAEKQKYQQQVNDIMQNYNELKVLMQQTSDQQVQTLTSQLEEEKTNFKQLNQELLKVQAEFKIINNRLNRSQEKLLALVPAPDNEVAAFKPDGKVVLIDEAAKIVHLDLGIDDRVYRGLTFSVYDKNTSIPRDGKGKAEIEVFDVRKNISSARIIRSEMTNPVITGDIIANLIWNSDKANTFVVAGDFDLDSNGKIDYNAIDKIKTLIEKWGGTVSNAVAIDTDFLVLGKPPEILKKPTFEEMEVDPVAMSKYEASLQKLALYKEILNQAQLLSIPIFNAERFLYFIGYKTQSSKAGAF